MVATHTHPNTTNIAVFPFAVEPDDADAPGGGVGGGFLGGGAAPDQMAVVAVMPALRKAVKKFADCMTAVAFVAGPLTVNVTPPPAASLTLPSVSDAASAPVAAASVAMKALRSWTVSVACV